MKFIARAHLTPRTLEMTSKAADEPVAARNIWIDLLRGFCLLSVLLTHGLIDLPAGGGTLARSFSDAFVDKGYFGVATFFVISGFLIMGNTLRRYGDPEKIDFGQFYAMRAARILPCLLLFIVIMVGLAYSGLTQFAPPAQNLLWGSAYAALTLQYNSYYFLANAPGLHHWAPLWSLSIEELFYLVFPIACFLSGRRRVFVALLATIVIFGPLYRREFADVFGFWGAADLLAIGCLAALAKDRFSARLAGLGWPLLLAGGGIVTAIFVVGKVREGFAFTPTALGFGAGLFLIGAASLPPLLRRNRLLDAFAALGRVSYEAYLFHVALIIALKPAILSLWGFVGAPPLATQLANAASLLLLIYWFSSMLSRYVTEPLNSRIRRFYRAG